jgi:hypothetical protein
MLTEGRPSRPGQRSIVLIHLKTLSTAKALAVLGTMVALANTSPATATLALVAFVPPPPPPPPCSTACQVRNSARIFGDPVLYRKMEAASQAIKRDICFASSLYLA